LGGVGSVRRYGRGMEGAEEAWKGRGRGSWWGVEWEGEKVRRRGG